MTNQQLAMAAARYWSELWRATDPSIGDDTLAKFREALVPAVVAELEGREQFNGQVGSGSCDLVCDYDPFEPLLSAVRAAGIKCRGSMFSAEGIFPSKHRMYIEAGRIRVVEGYGAPNRWLDLQLHVFQFDGDIRETVIAHDVEDAWRVIEESTGCSPEEYRESNGPDDGNFVKLDDAQLFKLRCEGDPIEHNFPNHDGWTKDAHGVWRSERTCAEWVQHAGRGHLGSSEW